MWFLFFEICFLIGLSFLIGSGATALALRMLLPATDNDGPRTGDVTAAEVTS
jgi:hypothetical protein